MGGREEREEKGGASSHSRALTHAACAQCLWALIHNVNAYLPSAAQLASLDNILACFVAMQCRAQRSRGSTGPLLRWVLRYRSIPSCVVAVCVRRWMFWWRVCRRARVGRRRGENRGDVAAVASGAHSRTSCGADFEFPCASDHGGNREGTSAGRARTSTDTWWEKQKGEEPSKPNRLLTLQHDQFIETCHELDER